MARIVHIILFVAIAATSCVGFRKPLHRPSKQSSHNIARGNKPDLYYVPPSPPCRVILMTVNVLGTDVNLKYVDLAKQEQLKPEYLKINPQHTVPALDDKGFTLGESRAIQKYLAEKSPGGETIYPKDIKKRAKIDEMLYFDVGRLYPQFMANYGIGTGNSSDENQKKFAESLGILEEYITRNGWTATNQMTLADLSLLGTVTLTEAVGYNISMYPKITDWVSKTKSAVPNYAISSQIGLDIWKSLYEASKKKN